eukprot:1159658-Pelagomonas_calceolata.AAC.6
MDEFTAANIGMEEDKRAAEKSTVDMEKMRKDIGEQIALANQTPPGPPCAPVQVTPCMAI